MSKISEDLKKGKKNKWVAILLAFFLGGIGAHKFYLGKTGWGIVYLLLFLTVFGAFISVIIGIIEAVLYLTMSDAEFAKKYN